MAGTNSRMLEKARRTSLYMKYGSENGEAKMVKAPFDIIRYEDGTYVQPCHHNVVEPSDPDLANNDEWRLLSTGAMVPISDIMIIEKDAAGDGTKDSIISMNSFSTI